MKIHVSDDGKTTRCHRSVKGLSLAQEGESPTCRSCIKAPVYRVTCQWTVFCVRCGKSARTPEYEGLLWDFPKQLPKGWVCDLGDKRPFVSPSTGKPVELFDSGLVLASPAPYCSRKCASAAGARGPIAAAPTSSR